MLRSDGNAQFIYVKPSGAHEARRLTTRTTGYESQVVLARDGSQVAYAVASGPEAQSEVWVSDIDGSATHRVSTTDQDATMPSFFPDGKALLYVISRFNGHYSPIARPRRHDFDIVRIALSEPSSNATPVELTHQKFFDMRSLAVSPDGEHFLLSTSGYPIGDLIEEFEIAAPDRIHKIFQPHVPHEPSISPSFGDATYSDDGMDIFFTAATDGASGNYDYNVYRMSDVTGGEIQQLTRHAGLIDHLEVAPGNVVSFVAQGQKTMVSKAGAK